MVVALISQIAGETLRKLEFSWTLAGYDEDARECERHAILHEFQNICDNKVKEAEAEIARLTAQRDELAAATAAIYEEMAEEYDPVATVEQGELNLKQSIVLHSKALEVAEGKRTLRMRELTSLYEKLRFELLQMNDELSAEDQAFLGPYAHLELTRARMQRFSSRIEAVLQQKATRATLVCDAVQRIQRLWQLMSMAKDEACVGAVEEKMWNDGPTGLGVKESTITALREVEARLEGERVRREHAIADQLEQLHRLWDLLTTDERERKAYTDSHSGLSSRIIAENVMEIERLSSIKRARLAELIESARSRINTVWEEMRLSQAERDAHPFFTTVVMNEDTLQQCRSAIDRAEARLETMAPLLKLVAKREKLLKENAELEAASHDSERLLSRGKRDPGRLLREEKIRNMVAKELPKMEENLRSGIAEWQALYQDTFSVNGVPFLATMEADIERSRLTREEEKLRRQNRATTDASDKPPVGALALSSSTVGVQQQSTMRPSATATPRKVAPAVASTATPSRGLTPSKRPLGPSSATNIVSIQRTE